MARRRKGKPVHGWVVVDKPEGLTSTQVVGKVRHLFDAQKAGHGGTLDPLASGVLPIALGEATKTVSHAMAGHKVYRFEVCWGEARTTDDREGEVVERSDRRPDEAAILGALPRFVGRIEQKPPAFSAIKVDGERSYDLARKGQAKDLSPRPVVIDRLDLIRVVDADHAAFEVVCGKGTYVRALARDLAQALGTVAHVSVLRRTRVGPFCESQAISLAKLEELSYRGPSCQCLLPVETVLDDIPALAVTGREAQRLRQGQPLLLNRNQTDKVCGRSHAYAALGNSVVALGEVKSGQFRPTRVFHLPIKGKHIDVDYG